ncbi:MAG: endonuclease domain-containing protein [Moorellaceae bacterium]
MGYFDDKWEMRPIEMIKHVDQRIYDFLLEIINDFLLDFVMVMDECESPIEQLLACALLAVGKGRNLDFWIQPQYEVVVGGVRYRIDFCVHLADKEPSEYSKKLLIECDGHDFHEKTKEQAARDKQKDRKLMLAGYKVVRFTGHEIWSDPFKCAREVFDLLMA